jgi:site-specific DNA-methyltransferase (adenine-specific)
VLGKGLGAGVQDEPGGRWPSNVVLDEEAAAELDEQSGTLRSGERPARRAGMGFDDGKANRSGTTGEREVLDSGGGASRFFPVFRYQAKAPTRERPKVDGVAHPTVKPLDLMRWLVRLVTPVDGIVLDPFAGSGTTLEAAVVEGMRCVGIEQSADYLPLIEARMARVGLVAQ